MVIENMWFIKKALHSIPPRLFRKVRTSRMIQVDLAESGAIALSIVLRYYKKFVPIEELREACSISAENSGIENILGVAEDYGLAAEKYSGDIIGLLERDLPTILSWKSKQFIVLEGVDREGFYINDPASGRFLITYENFEKHFQHEAIIIKPKPSFQASGQSFSLRRFFIPHLIKFRWWIFLISIVSLGYALLGLALPAGVLFFLDEILFSQNFALAGSLICFLFLAMGLTAGFLYWYHYAFNLLKLSLSISLSSHLMWHLLRLPISYFVQRYSGDVAYKVILCDKVSEQCGRFVSSFFFDSSICLVFGVALFSYDIPLALFIIGTACFSGGIIYWANKFKSDVYGTDEIAKETLKTVELSGLKGIESLKSSASEYRYLSMWLGYFTKYLNREQTLGKVNCFFNILPPLSSDASTVFFMTIGTLKIINGEMTVGMFIAMQILMMYIFSSVFNLADLIHSIEFLKEDVEQLQEIWDNKIDPDLTLASVEELTLLKGYVELHDISFSYSPRSKQILKDIRLMLSPGKCTVLVGPSGSGRSTLAKVIAGIYPFTSGKLLFDEKPRSEIPRMQFVHSLALVEQEPFLFPGTIRENLSFMNPDAPFDEIVAACKDACIHEDILKMRGGYEYVMTENGMNISDGQRQRIELARNLLKNPSILLLDEATSALDHVTELKIIKNVCRRGCSVFMITHHMNTIRMCDEIIVIYKGQIMASGRYEELTPILGPQLDSFTQT